MLENLSSSNGDLSMNMTRIISSNRIIEKRIF